MKYFVSDASQLSKIKKCQLRKLLMVGSCQKTPIESKAIAEPENCVNGYIYTVKLYNPNCSYPGPSRIFELNDQTRISAEDWFEIFSPIEKYPEFFQYVTHKEEIKLAIAELELASIEFGKALEIVNSGAIDPYDEQEFLRSSKKRKSQAHRTLSELVIK